MSGPSGVAVVEGGVAVRTFNLFICKINVSTIYIYKIHTRGSKRSERITLALGTYERRLELKYL